MRQVIITLCPILSGNVTSGSTPLYYDSKIFGKPAKDIFFGKRLLKIFESLEDAWLRYTEGVSEVIDIRNRPLKETQLDHESF